MVLKITLKQLLATIGALFLLAVTIAWSGIINVGASTGHWDVTAWVLHWSMRNSVRTQAALSVEEPAIGATGLVSAAGHYAANCAACHGAPGEPPSPVMQAATPPAPDLSETAGSWSDKELFWIVKNGVKATPMPAWPALGRDDEIRRMTAFVRRLPNMSAAEYRALAYGPDGKIVRGRPMRMEDVLADCRRCHAEGRRDQPDIPVLAGQKWTYLLAALDAFASGERESGVMGAAAARLDRDLRLELARHYAEMPGLTASRATVRISDTTASADERLAARIVAEGMPEADLPACSKCHAPGKRPEYPSLSGQKPEYLAARLHLWRGDPNIVEAKKPDDSMPMIARRIPEHLIEPLARHLSGQTRGAMHRASPAPASGRDDAE